VISKLEKIAEFDMPGPCLKYEQLKNARCWCCD
jgi:hypothetical protein